MTDYDSQTGRDMPPADEVSSAQELSDDHEVTTAVQGLAGLVSDVDDLEDVLAQIAGFAVAAVPGADGAGVSVVRAGEGAPAALAWAVTDRYVREIDHLQYDICGEGPCLTAMQSGRALVSGSLGSDRRWPRFGGRAARMNVHSAMALPLLVRGEVVGAIQGFSRERDAFTERALRLAEQFALPAAVTVRNLQVLQAAHTQAAQLQTALINRAVIDQAIGIVRSRSGGSQDEAFARLRQISQSQNVKVAVVAQRLVDEAVRRAHARNSESTRSARNRGR